MDQISLMTEKYFQPADFQDIYQKVAYEEGGKAISLALASLSLKYQLSNLSKSLKDKINSSLTDFNLLKGYGLISIIGAIRVMNNDKGMDLIIVSVDSSHQKNQLKTVAIRENPLEFEILGLVDLKKDYGNVFISPESLIDKVSEFFDPVEIDFKEDKKFSSLYYVLSEDEKKARAHMSAGLLKAIRTFDDLHIEIRGQKMLVRQQHGITIKHANTICEFAMSVLDGNN
jgi:hypothetical protein